MECKSNTMEKSGNISSCSNDNQGFGEINEIYRRVLQNKSAKHTFSSSTLLQKNCSKVKQNKFHIKNKKSIKIDKQIPIFEDLPKKTIIK